MKFLSSLLFVGLFTFACSPQSEQIAKLTAIYQENDIQEVSDSFYQTENGRYLDRVVGSLVFAESHVCTAFLIDESTVATANHCYKDILHGLYTFRSKMGEFKVRHSPKRYKEVDVVLLPLILDDYEGELPHLNFGEIDLLNSEQEYSLVSRTGNFTMTLSEKLEKPVGLEIYPMVQHTLDTVKGGSGSPIIQNGKVVAIHVGHTKKNNFGVLTSYISETEHSYEWKRSLLPKGFIVECAACVGPKPPSGRGSDAEGNADTGGYDDNDDGYGDEEDRYTDYCNQHCENNRANSRDEATDITSSRLQTALLSTALPIALVTPGRADDLLIIGGILTIGGSAYIEETYKDSSIWQSDAKAPGIPTQQDGFVPHKKWDGKSTVRVPGSKERGFPARDGSVWVPTGPKRSRAHGGPHWDVQRPDGTYINVYPGGKERK